MTSPLARPTFFEGEILPASDLVATVDYARGQMARHARYAHTWGIVSGLQLSYSSGVTLSAGVAIDGTGREIVVTAAVQLDPTQFDVFPQADPTTLYPVFLNGVDQAAAASSSAPGSSTSSQATSIQEYYVISFGSPGSELAVQNAPAITDGPDGGGSGAWLILVGFVTWDSTSSSFSGMSLFNSKTNVGPQYIGVNASQVAAADGSLLLTTHPPASPGSNPVMALQIQEGPPAQLVFGKLNSDGSVNPAFTVDANGGVSANGKFQAAVTPGSMQVQSGIAFDGMILPLPVGISPATVDPTTVHTHVTVHYEYLGMAPLMFLVPFECRVDPATFRVYCQVMEITGAVAGSPQPAWCDYTVIVAVPASGS